MMWFLVSKKLGCWIANRLVNQHPSKYYLVLPTYEVRSRFKLFNPLTTIRTSQYR